MISELIYEIEEKKKFDRKFVWKLIKRLRASSVWKFVDPIN